MKPQQILSLTATRGIAALMVVVYHFGCLTPPFNKAEHFFRSANLAVSYFFVLSGFVMYISYSKARIQYGGFLIRRLGRIGPAYLLGIALTLLVAHVYLHPVYNGEFYRQLLLNVLFLQAYSPGDALSINAPGWSLSVEMFFYLLFPLVMLFARQHQKQFLAFGAGVFIISQCIHLGMINILKPGYPSETHELIYYYPIFHLNEFLVGMVAGCFYQEGRWKILHHFSLPIFIVIILAVNYGGNIPSMHNGLLAPAYGLLILGIAYEEPIALKNAVMLTLGKLSFAIYILQQPVYTLLTHLNQQKLKLGESIFFYFYLSALIVVSAISYYLLEEPVRKGINACLDARKERAV